MPIHKLTPRKVASAGPGKHEDGGGLRLVVSRTGAKKWMLRFTLHGQRREMGLGSLPDVGLAEAREKAAECRKQVKRGIDPIAARRRRPAAPTFTACAARYVQAHRHGWTSAKHARPIGRNRPVGRRLSHPGGTDEGSACASGAAHRRHREYPGSAAHRADNAYFFIPVAPYPAWRCCC